MSFLFIYTCLPGTLCFENNFSPSFGRQNWVSCFKRLNKDLRYMFCPEVKDDMSILFNVNAYIHYWSRVIDKTHVFIWSPPFPYRFDTYVWKFFISLLKFAISHFSSVYNDLITLIKRNYHTFNFHRSV